MGPFAAFSGMSLAAAQIRHQELLRQGYQHRGVLRDHDGQLHREDLDALAEQYRSEGKDVLIIDHAFGLDMYWRDVRPSV